MVGPKLGLTSLHHLRKQLLSLVPLALAPVCRHNKTFSTRRYNLFCQALLAAVSGYKPPR